MNHKFGWAIALGVALVLSACGKNDTLDRQADQRESMGPASQGVWSTTCDNQTMNALTFANDRLTVERVTYGDKDCTVKMRTLRHSGKFALAYNYKSSPNNTIVFIPDSEVRLTLHRDADINQQNVSLSLARKQETTPIQLGISPEEEANARRENQKIIQVKLVTDWDRDQEKVLSRLQLEKLNEARFGASNGTALNAQPAADFNSRLALRYELDNGYLQISGGNGDFSRVFTKN